MLVEHDRLAGVARAAGAGELRRYLVRRQAALRAAPPSRQHHPAGGDWRFTGTPYARDSRREPHRDPEPPDLPHTRTPPGCWWGGVQEPCLRVVSECCSERALAALVCCKI